MSGSHDHGLAQAERAMDPSYEGSVVLAVGGLVGALVLYAPGALLGAEVEIARLGAPGYVTHSSFRERRLGSAVMCAAVYPGLPEGDYQVHGYPQVVHVDGGRVSEAQLVANR
jgi:hypothetical protein